MYRLDQFIGAANFQNITQRACSECFLDEGKVRMRANNVLGADEVAEGWVLTCQAIPTSREVVVDYDR